MDFSKSERRLKFMEPCIQMCQAQVPSSATLVYNFLTIFWRFNRIAYDQQGRVYSHAPVNILPARGAAG